MWMFSMPGGKRHFIWLCMNLDAVLYNPVWWPEVCKCTRLSVLWRILKGNPSLYLWSSFSVQLSPQQTLAPWIPGNASIISTTRFLSLLCPGNFLQESEPIIGFALFSLFFCSMPVSSTNVPCTLSSFLIRQKSKFSLFYSFLTRNLNLLLLIFNVSNGHYKDECIYQKRDPNGYALKGWFLKLL